MTFSYLYVDVILFFSGENYHLEDVLYPTFRLSQISILNTLPQVLLYLGILYSIYHNTCWGVLNIHVRELSGPRITVLYGSTFTLVVLTDRSRHDHYEQYCEKKYEEIVINLICSKCSDSVTNGL